MFHKNCNVGKGVVLENSILGMASRVGDGASLSYSKIGVYAGLALHASVAHSFIGDYSSIGRYSKVFYAEIGKFCAISWDVTINAINHRYKNLTINAFPYVPYVGHFVEIRDSRYDKVVIKNDVWIGANSVIMPGITIGNGAVIGAGAVVTKNVPDYAIVVGVPAKVLKYRFDQSVINRLLEIKWWDMDRETIKKNIDIFQGEFTPEKMEKLEKIYASQKKEQK